MTGVAHTEWPAKGQVSPLHGLITTALKEAKKDLPTVAVVACDEASRNPEGMDVYLFHKWGNRKPIFLKGITAETHNKLVPFLQALEDAGETAAEDSEPFMAPPCPYEALEVEYERFIFTCAHVTRDMRCGYCGSKLHDLIVEEINSRGLKQKVLAGRVTHVGGHAFAGNVLFYPEGIWYGYLRPADVPRLFEEHIAGDKVLIDKLRGKLGFNKTENAELASKPLTVSNHSEN
jgi:hypothetical protein